MLNRTDKKSWRWSAASLAGIALLGLAAMWTSQAAAEKITIGALRFTSHSPTFIAKERGYFKAEGLDVELKFFQAAQPIAVAIASGDIDFGVTALTGGFYSLADKGALKVIGGLYTEAPKHPGMAIMASNKAHAAGLTSPEALKGRSWAMTQQGSSFHYMIGMIGAKHGFALADVSVKPLQKVGAMIGAVKSGQVDAMAMVPHVAIPLEKAGAAKIIGWIRDIGSYQVTTIFTSSGNVKDHRGKVERFLRAYRKGIADYRAVMLDQKKDPAATEAMVDLIHKYVYTSRPRAKAAPPIKAGAVFMTEDAALDVPDLKRQLAWFQAQGFAPKTLTAETYIDASFLN
ncbi:MAG: ABC transporter substrate-binding protein [Deltaproteobacteria bacterium]|nr:ABC transporter substrate-binding protein [Deltaproteobacteria bacterium]